MSAKVFKPAAARALRIGAVLLLCATPAWAGTEYRLAPGDKLELSVYGAPDMQRRTTVNADGMISLPLMGDVPVAGLTVSEARQKIQGILSERKLVSTPDVTLEIAEYRPFFISGDVARPGAYQYQPGMTARQAVALAGGYDMVRFRFGDNPFVSAANLRSEYETLRSDLLTEVLNLARLKAELAEQRKLAAGDATDIPISPETFQQAVALEQRQLDERMTSLDRDRQSMTRSIERAKQTADTLEQQMNSENEGVTQQVEDTQKLKMLSEKGVVPASRYLDEQRALILAKSRYLATMAQVTAARRGLEELQRQAERQEETRKGDLLRQIEASNANIDKIKSRIQASAEKFSVVGSARSSILAASGGDADVTIYRNTGGKAEVIRADPSSEIQPNDTVEITLRASRLLGMAVQTRSE